MENFQEREFSCKCGKCQKGFKDMDPKTLEKLERARKIADIPFFITSAMRCAEHNSREGGSQTSSHLNGTAIDIDVKSSRDRFLIIDSLIKAGFNRVGIAKTFIHADTDTKTEKVIWLY